MAYLMRCLVEIRGVIPVSAVDGGRPQVLAGLARWGGVALAMVLAGAAVAQTEPEPEAEPEPGQITQQDHEERRRQTDELVERTIAEYNRARSRVDGVIKTFATPLRYHGCEGLLLQFAPMRRYFEGLFPLAAAHLILEGRCFAPEPAVARKLIEARLAKKPTDYEALGLMGTLYYRGLGVARDEARARVYFKKAALWAGWWLIGQEDSLFQPAGKEMADFWGASIDDYWLLLINDVTGPWALPAPLREDVEWVRLVKQEGPQAIMRVAFDLRRGSDGLPRDAALAYRWLEKAAYYRYVPSYYPYAVWTRERKFTERRRALGNIWNREFELGGADPFLIKAAMGGDQRASPMIYRLLLHTPDYYRRDWAIYYWLLRMRRDGHAVDDDAIDTAGAALLFGYREMIEGWEDDKLPPFTRLEETEWQSD